MLTVSILYRAYLSLFCLLDALAAGNKKLDQSESLVAFAALLDSDEVQAEMKRCGVAVNSKVAIAFFVGTKAALSYVCCA